MSKKRIVIIVSTIVILLLLIIGYILTTTIDDTEEPGASPQQKQQTTQEAPQASVRQPSTPGKYVTYEEQEFSEDQGSRLLFFHAPWCPQCQKLETSIKQQDLPDNLTIYKVDYDTATALRQKYGVTLQTTVVKVDQNGDTLSKIVAYDEPTYALLKRSLNL